ncbi:inner membrane protein YgaZ [Peptococcaceae bacterium CEB3]|nr:inner membrane protein YgaZ [Peptococcaceae bacterium CEB3]
MPASPVKAALQDSMPIVTAYFPIAMTFGVLSVAGGIVWWMTILISACVYAGGAQFMLVGLVLANSSPVSTVVTVLLVNLRHFLYGTTLGPAFQKWTEKHKWIAAFGLTDEVFAVTSSRLQEKAPTPLYQFVFVFACYGSWVAGTIAGVGIGSAVPTAISQVLGFALPALFLALLFLGERSAAHLIAALSGALLAIAATLLHMGSAGIVIGAVAGATLGLLAREYSGKLRQKVE